MTALLPRIAPIFVVSLLGCGSVEYGSEDARHASTEVYESEETISLSVFYEELAPYGEWKDVAQHGRVFVPHDPEYRPYRNGHWVESDEGLVWVSYDAIGWAVCHYGQWLVLDDGRWAWIPDTEWAPAWVEWRRSDRYVGWAPELVGGSVPIVDLWVFVEVAYLLADFALTAALPPAQIGYAYADCAPFVGRGGGWHGPSHGWMRARGVHGVGTGRPTRVVRPGPPRRRPPAGPHVRPADGRRHARPADGRHVRPADGRRHARPVGRHATGEPTRVRRPGEPAERDGVTRVRRPDGAGGLDGPETRERPVLRLHGPADPAGPVTAARAADARPSVDPSRARPSLDVPTPRRAPSATLDAQRALPSADATPERRVVPEAVARPERTPPVRIERAAPDRSRPVPFLTRPSPAMRRADHSSPPRRVERAPSPRPSPVPRVHQPAPRPSPPSRFSAPSPRPSPVPRVHQPAPRPSSPRFSAPTPRPSPSPRVHQPAPRPSAPTRVAPSRPSPSQARPPSRGSSRASRPPSRPAVRAPSPSRGGGLRMRR